MRAFGMVPAKKENREVQSYDLDAQAETAQHYTQQLSNSATQQLSNSATQQLSNSATQSLGLSL